ncbi:hypothetical protein [Riemerella anatipestifer]|uniref:hypothetical protein n=1 Tax=Riemerella anatipestifer TaxID=34085 RepID=UPI00069BB02E|nr:hypothetical protein [Riemerella anatipestifer]
MKRLLFFAICLTGLLSCTDKKLESRVTALEKKFNYTNDSVKLISYSQGLLHQNELTEEKDGDDYWDISLDSTGTRKGIPFVYHRKNESELWQPVDYVMFSNEYVRIPSQFGALNNEQYLIININYDIKKKKVVYE